MFGSCWAGVLPLAALSTRVCVCNASLLPVCPLLNTYIHMHMRPYFRARTVNDNGPGAESAGSNAFSVGRPKAPAVQATGSSTGVKVAFTPDTPETGDTWVYWAEDASAGSSEQWRLDEATVGSVAIREGECIVGSG